jgi:hypothetical protein
MEPITTLSRMVSAETSRLNLTAALGDNRRARDGEAFNARRLTSVLGHSRRFWHVRRMSAHPRLATLEQTS